MIEFSKEVLLHFKCDMCKKWWTVGDWKQEQNMCCPHCGIIHYEFAEASKNNASELKKNANRYEKVRRLAPIQFSVIYQKNLEFGISFDKLIDEL